MYIVFNRLTPISMKLQQFRELSVEEKLAYIQVQGSQLDQYRLGYYTYKMYAIDTFFVQLICRNRDDKVVEIKSFVDGNMLSYYTEGRKL